LNECQLTQGELARRIGVSQQTISRLAAGERYGTKHLHRIARELGTTPAYLAGETDDPDGPGGDAPRLSAVEREWLELLTALPEDQRKALRLIARGLVTAAPAIGRLHDRRQDFTMPDQG
jgi:transcriptional regulator with XRE-family HTH domain